MTIVLFSGGTVAVVTIPVAQILMGIATIVGVLTIARRGNWPGGA